MANVIETVDLFKQNLINLVEKTCQPVLELLDTLTDSIEKKKFSLDSEEQDVINEMLYKYDIEDVDTFLNLDKFQKELQTLINTLNPKVVWIPETESATLFNYHIGNSPWSLTLVSEDWKTRSMEIQEEIMMDYNQGGIQRFQNNATIGDPVYFLKNEKLYRGIITDGTSDEDECFGITNIDNGHSLFCEKDTFFCPTICTQAYPAQALICSVVTSEEFDESVWCAELENIFKTVLLECKLKIASWTKNSSVPPKFTVRLFGVNDKNEEVDLTKWLEEDILRPWVSEGVPSKISANRFFGKRFQDPFKKKNSSVQIPTKLVKLEHQSPHALTLANNLAFHPKLNVDTTLEQLKKLLEQRRNNLFEAPSNYCGSSTSISGSEDMNKVLQAVEMAANTELAQEHEALDDSMICQQFKMFSYCIKKNCDKIHKKPANGIWTDDKTKTYTSSLNSLVLPKVNDTVIIKILELLDGCNFYALLPNNHFAINGIPTTIIQEMDRINNPNIIRGYNCLKTPPKIGEIVLAHCDDNTYYRGRVTGLGDQRFQIFLVDYGRTENVSFHSIKSIDETFLHYPFQAVRTHLAGITCKHPNKTKTFLSAMVGHCFKADVVECDEADELLIVRVYIGNYETTLNEILVENDLCEFLK